MIFPFMYLEFFLPQIQLNNLIAFKSLVISPPSILLGWNEVENKQQQNHGWIWAMTEDPNSYKWLLAILKPK